MSSSNNPNSNPRFANSPPPLYHPAACDQSDNRLASLHGQPKEEELEVAGRGPSTYSRKLIWARRFPQSGELKRKTGPAPRPFAASVTTWSATPSWWPLMLEGYDEHHKHLHGARVAAPQVCLRCSVASGRAHSRCGEVSLYMLATFTSVVIPELRSYPVEPQVEQQHELPPWCNCVEQADTLLWSCSGGPIV
jgi:hypothetical protein